MVLATSCRRDRARAGSSRWRGGTWDSHRRGGVAPAPETPGGGSHNPCRVGLLGSNPRELGRPLADSWYLAMAENTPVCRTLWSFTDLGEPPPCKTQDRFPREESVGSTPTSGTARRGRSTSPSRRPVLQ